MHYRPAIALIACAALAGCASTPNAADPKQQVTETPHTAGVIGTWRWVSVTEHGTTHPISSPFFMRFFPNGDAASWPTPELPVSRGKYSFANGRLSLGDGPDAKAVPVHLTDSELSYTANGGHCVYRRVTPDLEPGQLP
jgi:hypothetical protein